MTLNGMLEALNAAAPDARQGLVSAYAGQLASYEGSESLGQLLGVPDPAASDVARRCKTVRARNILINNAIGDSRDLLRWVVSDIRHLRTCGRQSLVDILSALLISLVDGNTGDQNDGEQTSRLRIDATLGDLLERWAASLDERRRLIFRHRVVRRDRNLDYLGNELGVSRERIRQLEKKVAEDFAGWRETTAVAERVSELSDAVRVHASPLMTIEQAIARIAELSAEIYSFSLELSAFLGVLLPDLDIDEPWLAMTSLSDLRDATFHAAVCCDLVEGQCATLDQIRAELLLDAADWAAWLNYCGLRSLGDLVVRKGASQPELTVAVLRAEGRPLSVEEIAERIQVDTIRSLRNRLQEDDRISRVGPNSYGLPEWDLETYEGIREEIVQRIERGGGRAWLSDVVDELVEQFGVSPASVRAYAARREFSRRDGWISLAGNGDDGPSQAPRRMPTPGETRRCFFLRGQWWFRVDINKEVLRGSGFTAPRGVMALFQVAEGTERVFAALAQEIRISWAAPQPQFGSIRSLATELQAKIGDVLWLAPTDHGTVRARLVRAWSKTEDDEIALRAGAPRGLSGEDLRSAIAGALALSAQTSWAALVMALRARGDLNLAEILESYTLSESFRAHDSVPDLDDFFAALGGQ
ncbi:hypothetical protein C1I98_02010 [Spongiactinospora gelatinilytica]|uniref:RNA polymerase sigma-70 region 4 domain-containing protein n=1 Tax=Spongiactinospora gelatinilytica TaxID=2666298 RepID=A0A2W2H860_9ACTN|nr:sigma factor-like helix-turn-helix DNA-binding protein [Spongiactinospora gelatinilytica]PZG56073.1 hypothetical protein C1I98_02010 [Spongiactinospora gelatinilytica]